MIEDKFVKTEHSLSEEEFLSLNSRIMELFYNALLTGFREKRFGMITINMPELTTSIVDSYINAKNDFDKERYIRFFVEHYIYNVVKTLR